MKGSGMDKLIELLNEFDENRKIGKNGLYKWEEYDPREEYIISKNFGFIKWLVDNDKIDVSNIKRIIKDYEVEDKENLEYYDLDFATKEETLLMLLAIQENPITFLISILK